jgi:hypothetical protein
MAKRFGVVLHPAELRWAATDGVSGTSPRASQLPRRRDSAELEIGDSANRAVFRPAHGYAAVIRTAGSFTRTEPRCRATAEANWLTKAGRSEADEPTTVSQRPHL